MDKLLINGSIRTMDPELPKAEAIAIKDGIIQAVGTTKEIMTLQGENTEVIDLQGKMLLPGLIDAHCHPAMTAYFINALQFDEEMTLDEILQSLKEYVQAHPEKETYFGTGRAVQCAWVRGSTADSESAAGKGEDEHE